MVKAKEAVALIERIKELLAEKKAENVVALDLRRVSETLDYFVVASATSTPTCRPWSGTSWKSWRRRTSAPGPPRARAPVGWSWTTGRWWSTS